MEKKISISRGDVIKYLIFFGSIISAFAANQYSIMNHRERIEKLEKEIKEMKECQNASAVQIAEINAKQDLMYETVIEIRNRLFNFPSANGR